ncbi:thymidine phosphorylase family protein [Fluoribacter dumoffii]|uniref:thymidine phosphorylase family protein n=1 Tax=Fluoribacter dumoffii TaxID=463 RepID=UPI00026C76DA|nr:thymidine phosphorylase family protein [Fluoribacter dumoffii]MCW8418592.1 thymidine phosphorylase family protein [Fluoribacter dumoffii]MCW8453565.1 thymidine phosphorylase family protein [Fluoribacter dumoffii]MCW8459216.1 thymidine phosphorylase family protein [Fluoribacter dumoffii]MCW8482575.1 thymidine phosphorylase family protein [Fluoribacter dumoffii]
MSKKHTTLTLKYLGINTHKEPVIYMREDCYICKSEGFTAQTRVRVILNKCSIVATLNTIETSLLRHNEASLSIYAWELLSAKEGDEISVIHPQPLDSLSYIRSKIYGNELTSEQTEHIIKDIVSGQLSDINIAMYIAASGGDRLSKKEIIDLTRAMINSGQKLSWAFPFIVDKHSVGGLPGNRTTPIVVSIVAAFGLVIPKTSSRAITSPAGTADTMEVFTNVELSLNEMQKVVEQENGCLVWGGSMALSPADDLLIRIERTANIDSEGQMVASILSKKIAAGSNHLVIDMPIGTTAKVRSIERANSLKKLLELVAEEFDLKIKVIFSDGSQPVGRGIGPVMEALDVLAVLNCDKQAPQDLREHALTLAAHIIEFSPNVLPGQGLNIATHLLNSGKALTKFESICQAQGGLKEIKKAPIVHTIESTQSGIIINIDNRHISQLAKLAGAPKTKAAGVELLTELHSVVKKYQPLFRIYAETRGELNYALDFLKQGHELFQIEAST